MSPISEQDVPVPNWHPDEWLGDQHDDKQELLLEMRGGCRCFLCAPCGACVEPISDEEAALLELVPFPEKPEAPSIDYMRAVHDLCR